MGQSFFNPQSSQNSNSGTFNGPKFFALKKDKDYAIVRFMYSTPEEFQIFETHKAVTPKFKFGRTVYCPRDTNEPISKCPLCNAGYKVQQKFYVKMIVYIKNPDGTVSAEAKIWERPYSFAFELASKAELYGGLNNNLFIVTRHTPNPNNLQDTTYSVDLAPSNAYPDTMYANKPELFDNYNIVGSALYAPSVEDLNYYLVNGDFPQKINNANAAPATPAPVAPNPVMNQIPAQQVNYNTVPVSNAVPSPVTDPFASINNESPFNADLPFTPNTTPEFASAPQSAPVPNQEPQMQRPVRYY